MAAPVIEAAGLTKHFEAKRSLFGGSRGVVRADDGISFTSSRARRWPRQRVRVRQDDTAKLVLGLEERSGGIMRFGPGPEDLDAAGPPLSPLRPGGLQDPFASLNPRMRRDAIIPATHHPRAH
jgi:ABC-type glutathione transport system ATPase component